MTINVSADGKDLSVYGQDVVADLGAWTDRADVISVALLADALDNVGCRKQIPRLSLPARTGVASLVGRCRTTLWLDFAHMDPNTYELELTAVDALSPGDVMIAATGNSCRSGIWGELLSTAAMRRGAAGVITDGGVRDIAKMRQMGFPVFAQHLSAYDSFNRQKVVACDVRVEIGGVIVDPGDIVVADEDGVVFVPQKNADEVLAAALAKADAEDAFRDAVRGGMPALQAYATYKVL
jgi:regulator of RNase E activity RraA